MRRKNIAIVQARMSSTRLPKKVLAAILGKPMLHWMIERLKLSNKLDGIIIATTTKKADDVIEDFARNEGISCYRGSEMDIVDRCYQAAREMGAEVIVRITGDCPLVDPKLLDEMLTVFESGKYDFYVNVAPPTYPHGLDLEIASTKCLELLWSATRGDPFLSEWFRTYIMENPDKFQIGNHTNSVDLSAMRWTVDEKEDLEFVRSIYGEFEEKGATFFMQEIVELLRKKPRLAEINSNKYIRNKAYVNALAERNKTKEM